MIWEHVANQLLDARLIRRNDVDEVTLAADYPVLRRAMSARINCRARTNPPRCAAKVDYDVPIPGARHRK